MSVAARAILTHASHDPNRGQSLARASDGPLVAFVALTVTLSCPMGPRAVLTGACAVARTALAAGIIGSVPLWTSESATACAA
jgi:hypothetical protein